MSIADHNSYLMVICLLFCFFKQKTAYEMRISDWSSDVCSSDLAYFAMLAILGLIHIVDHPGIILETLNPLNALRFFYVDGFTAFIALGAVVLAVTGAEALYADMGHFGRGPIGQIGRAHV